MSDASDKKTREELLAEIEALRRQLAPSDAPGASSEPSFSRPITRREALANWIAPVILSVPVIGAFHSETARGQVTPTFPGQPTQSPPTSPPPTSPPPTSPPPTLKPSPPKPQLPTLASVPVPGLGLAGIAVLGGALAAAGAKLLKDRDTTSEKQDPEGDGGTE